MNYDLVVIGGGPAGLAAAIAANDQGIDNILIIERDKYLGGILQQCIHNGFGLHMFKEQLTGPEYAQRYIDKLQGRGIDVLTDTMVLDVEENKTVHAVNTEKGYMIINAKAIVLAMGCRERTAGAISLKGTRPSGIFTAGTAQRYINIEGYMPGKKVVILGSGDIGLIMARRMTLEGADVQAVVELLPFSGGLQRNISQCLKDFDIPLLLSHTVTRVTGNDRLETVEIAEVDENRRPIKGTEQVFDCDTLLLSVGLIPENELSTKAGVHMYRNTKGPVVNESYETSVDGIFACGNVLHVHDLVDYVSEESERAGKGAAAYIKNQLKREGHSFATEAGKGISYLLPNTVNLDNVEDSFELFFRVNNVYREKRLVVRCGDEIIQSTFNRAMYPGSMMRVKIKKDKLNVEDLKNISISVEDKDE